MNRYLAIIIAALTATEMQAFQLAPRLVVNIAIDQLRSDYMEAFAPFMAKTDYVSSWSKARSTMRQAILMLL